MLAQELDPFVSRISERCRPANSPASVDEDDNMGREFSLGEVSLHFQRSLILSIL